MLRTCQLFVRIPTFRNAYLYLPLSCDITESIELKSATLSLWLVILPDSRLLSNMETSTVF